MEEMLRGAVPGLETVTAWLALEVPVVWLAKVSETGLKLSEGVPTVTATAAEVLPLKLASPEYFAVTE